MHVTVRIDDLRRLLTAFHCNFVLNGRKRVDVDNQAETATVQARAAHTNAAFLPRGQLQRQKSTCRVIVNAQKKAKKIFGGAGLRSPYLPHAKRTLYQLSYTPTDESAWIITIYKGPIATKSIA